MLIAGLLNKLKLIRNFQINKIVVLETITHWLSERRKNEAKNNIYYQNFSSNTNILGIWDDHDYGKNDGSKITFISWYYTFKANIYPKQDNWTGQIAYGEGKKLADLLIYMWVQYIYKK